jgi:hypothetical protein
MPESVGMTAARWAAAIATDLTCRAAGRYTVIRTGRYFPSRTRLDYPNELSTIRESALQRRTGRFSRTSGKPHVAGAGVNVGMWPEAMLAAASKTSPKTNLRLRAFEPYSRAFARVAGTNSVHPLLQANPVTQVVKSE